MDTANTFSVWECVKRAAPKSLKQGLESAVTVVFALGYLYVTGNPVQMVEEMNWAWAVVLAVSFMFVLRLFNEVLTHPGIDRIARHVMLALLIAVCGSAFAFGYHGTTKRMDSAEIEEFRQRSYYTDIEVNLKDVMGSDYAIRNKTFEGCALEGPAYLYAISDIYIEESRIDTRLNFITVSDDVFARKGALLVDGCKFIDCWFINTALVGNASEIDQIQKGIVRKEGSWDALRQ